MQFRLWFEEVVATGLPEPEAMTLATATVDGRPSARMVLLKHVDPRGFVFYTNYEGRKAHELLDNPRAALVFFWQPVRRQVRIEGDVSMVSAEESDAYFSSRGRGSQLGAWASRQSSVIASRAALDRNLTDVERRFEDRDVPRPPYWGGFRVTPHTIEFWQGRVNRLHDRLVYRRTSGDQWVRERLSP